MPNRVDNHVPEHIKSAVTAGQTILAPFIENSGGVAVSIQTTCTNGAAGTLTLLGSNQLGKGSAWVEVATQTIAANQSVVMTNSLADDITSMYKLRVRFVASADGNVQCSINIRRTDY